MKKIFVMLMMVFSLTISAQSISGISVYDAPGSSNRGGNYVETPYRYNGVQTDTIFINKSNGRCIVHRKSKSSGKRYNKYLPEETSKMVARNMGVAYTYVKKER